MATSFIKMLHTSTRHTNSLLFSFLFFCVSHAPLQAATVQYENGLESGTLTGLRKHGTGIVEVTTTPVATGKYAAKYDLIRDNTKGHYRAENFPDYRKNNIEFNKEYWLSMNYIRTNWEKDRSAESGPFQIHRVPSVWKAGCGGEVSAFSVAPFVMFSQNDVEKIITNGGVVSWSGPIIKNQWQNIIFHFKITWDKTGYVEAWKDGKKLFRRDGKLHNQIDDCGQPFKSPVFKMGIYKWDWKLGSTQISYSNRRTLHIDNLRITKGPSLY
jgi:Polysaccharide lyase